MYLQLRQENTTNPQFKRKIFYLRILIPLALILTIHLMMNTWFKLYQLKNHFSFIFIIKNKASDLLVDLGKDERDSCGLFGLLESIFWFGRKEEIFWIERGAKSHTWLLFFCWCVQENITQLTPGLNSIKTFCGAC